jgi:sterol 3beta-glucosyltransferase
MVTSVNEGFHNVPKLYGTKVRPKKRVTGIKTGFQEGAKVRSHAASSFVYAIWSLKRLYCQAFYYGHKDGFSGLYTDPRNQYKKHGALGGE